MTTTEFPRIAAAIEVYFDALYFCDVDKLQSVFHPRAIYATADETPFLHRTMEEYFPIVAARQSPASRKEPRHDYIDSIEFAGENTAFARVRCSIGARDFVDFLTFVKVDGVWQIIAKVFQIIERPPQEH
ncbi:MAG: nuclear transport factor 2 family protein [Alphaproteobacteria bacterium]|nr:nuclear transport factor 2 family protein [Alphaproteobacteria bacterium]MBU0830818.1 nuclear transport factor 2 family protein [Alphaproteobacteria bacterium]MBU1765219.1 nuclear transport factor 2 family protein [Alphaproteobacteria bacterium]